MIINTFDNKSEAKINPNLKEGRFKCDACVITFSYIIEQEIVKEYNCEKIGEIKFVTGITPIYKLNYNGKTFAFFKTFVGAPAATAAIEDTLSEINTNKYIMFGGSGCLNKEISHGKIMIPTEAYRDEGTSYHYMEASDYVEMKNYKIVEKFMKEKNIPYVLGKTWTTDSFYRETVNNFEKHKADGCISVEMECAGVQAMCSFRDIELYYFLKSGDLLDSPEWDRRRPENTLNGTQHDVRYFDIALELADYITKE